MTDLHDLGTSLAGIDSGRDRIRIFTESSKDALFYNRLVGSRIRRYVEFVESGNTFWHKKSGAPGAIADIRSARADKERGVRATWNFCLVDGEESHRFGNGFEILEEQAPLFTIDDPKADGLLFLNCNEKENIFLIYGGALGQLLYDLDKFGESEAENARKFGRHNIGTLMARALLHAGLKAACSHSRGDRSRGNYKNLTSIQATDRDLVASYQAVMSYRAKDAPLRLNDDPFKTEEDAIFRKYWPELFNKFKAMLAPRTLANDPLAHDALRLCDAKYVMETVFGRSLSVWEEDYEQRVIESEYAFEFQAALVKAITAGQPPAAERRPWAVPPVHRFRRIPT